MAAGPAIQHSHGGGLLCALGFAESSAFWRPFPINVMLAP